MSVSILILKNKIDININLFLLKYINILLEYLNKDYIYIKFKYYL